MIFFCCKLSRESISKRKWHLDHIVNWNVQIIDSRGCCWRCQCLGSIAIGLPLIKNQLILLQRILIEYSLTGNLIRQKKHPQLTAHTYSRFYLVDGSLFHFVCLRAFNFRASSWSVWLRRHMHSNRWKLKNNFVQYQAIDASVCLPANANVSFFYIAFAVPMLMMSSDIITCKWKLTSAV